MNTLTDTLVSFETAKLAKCKGFKCECYQYYIDASPDRIIYINQEEQDAVTNSNCDYRYADPTQSLLQRWLREVHKIEAGVNYNYYQIAGKITYQKIVISNNYLNYRCTGSFNSYQEAFEESLKEALKLIK